MIGGNYPNYSGNSFNQNPDDHIKKDPDQAAPDQSISNNDGTEATKQPTGKPEETGSAAGKSAEDKSGSTQIQQTTPAATSNGGIVIKSSDDKSPPMSPEALKIKEKIEAAKARMLAKQQEDAKLLNTGDVISNDIDTKTTEISGEQQLVVAEKQIQTDKDQVQTVEKHTQSTENQVLIKETSISAIAAQAVKIKPTQKVFLSTDTHNLLKDLHAWSLDKNGHIFQVHPNDVKQHQDSLFFAHVDKDGVRPVLNKHNAHHKTILNDPAQFNKLKEHLAKHHGMPVLAPILLDNKQYNAFLQLMILVHLDQVQIEKDDKKDKALFADGDKKVHASQELPDLEPSEAKKFIEEMNDWLTNLSLILQSDKRRQELEKSFIQAKAKQEKEFFHEIMKKEEDRLAGIDAGHHQEQKEQIILDINPEDFLRERGFKV